MSNRRGIRQGLARRKKQQSHAILAKHLANLCVCSRFYCRGGRDDGWSAGSNTSVGLMARCVRRRSTVDPQVGAWDEEGWSFGGRREGIRGGRAVVSGESKHINFALLLSPDRPTAGHFPPPRSQCVGGDYGHPSAAAVARGQKLMVLGADLAPSASAVVLDSQEEEEEEVTAVSGRTSFFQWTYRMLGAPFLLPPLFQALPRATASERGKKGASETNDRITPSSSFGPLGGAVLRQERERAPPNPTGQPGQKRDSPLPPPRYTRKAMQKMRAITLLLLLLFPFPARPAIMYPPPLSLPVFVGNLDLSVPHIHRRVYERGEEEEDPSLFPWRRALCQRVPYERGCNLSLFLWVEKAKYPPQVGLQGTILLVCMLRWYRRQR